MAQEEFANINFVPPPNIQSGWHPETPTPIRRLQHEGTADYERFSTILVALGQQAMSDVVITRDQPSQDTETPVVTFGVIHKTPFPFEVKPRWRQDFPQVKCKWEKDNDPGCENQSCLNWPQYDDTCRLKHYPADGVSQFAPEGVAVVVWGQRFRYTVQCDCWGSTTTEAEKLVDRFEKMMFIYTGVFKLKGVSELLFSERLIDQTVKKWREDIYARSVRYRVHLEDLYVRDLNIIRKINIQLSERMRQDPTDFVLFNQSCTIT